MSWRSFIAELYPQRDLENSSIGRSVKACHSRDHAPSLSDVFPEALEVLSSLFKWERANKEPFLDIFGTLSLSSAQLSSAQLSSAQLSSSVTGLAPAKKLLMEKQLT
jgi:hypothetical protein